MSPSADLLLAKIKDSLKSRQYVNEDILALVADNSGESSRGSRTSIRAT